MKRAKGPEPVVGLDVGTTKICAVIGRPKPGGGLDVIGVGSAPSRGLRRGVVVNIDSTVEAIKQAVADAEQMAGVDVERVWAGVAGGHIRSLNSRGVVAISGREREVSAADVERAVEAARAINVPQDREIIHVLPQTFAVDDADGVREPIGMSGVRLEVEVHIVTAAVTSVQNVVRAVNRAGLTVQDVVLEPIASAEAVLLPDEKELGVVLIDIGGGTTDMALFRDGAIWHTAILPLGGDHITNDVAVGLRTAMADAEDLKKRYSCALTSMVPAEETAGIVVTGGTSIMEGVPELAEAIFDQPVRRGVPGDIGGLADVVRSPIHATAVGLALHGARRPAGVGAQVDPNDQAFLARTGRRLAAWFGEIF
jgi:cell division protein FtsA